MSKRMYHYSMAVTVLEKIDDMTALVQRYPSLPKYVWEMERWKSFLPMYVYMEDGEDKIRIDEGKHFADIV